MTSLHNALISALTTFYTLLVDLRYIPSSALIVPSSQTRRHPQNSINCRAAAQNGFSEAVIDLAYQIPCITDDYYRAYCETPFLLFFLPLDVSHLLQSMDALAIYAIVLHLDSAHLQFY